MFDDYMTGAFGTTEYPEEMYNIILSVKNQAEKQEIKYFYKNRSANLNNGIAEARIPDIDTLVSVRGEGDYNTYIREGYAFSPMYTLGVQKTLKVGEEIVTWLKLAMAN